MKNLKLGGNNVKNKYKLWNWIPWHVESLTGSIMWCIIFDENVGDGSISGEKIKDEFITDNIEIYDQRPQAIWLF